VSLPGTVSHDDHSYGITEYLPFIDFGIDDRFIRDVRDNVTPGTSALFLMTSNVVQDKVFDQFRSTGAQLVSTNLSVEQEQRLRDAFGEE
jgi:uncharacterized membrane protein